MSVHVLRAALGLPLLVLSFQIARTPVSHLLTILFARKISVTETSLLLLVSFDNVLYLSLRDHEF